LLATFTNGEITKDYGKKIHLITSVLLVSVFLCFLHKIGNWGGPIDANAGMFFEVKALLDWKLELFFPETPIDQREKVLWKFSNNGKTGFDPIGSY